MDFPNHLARIWLMAGGASEPPLSEVYRIDLGQAGTNLGVDLAAAALARVAPLMWVSKMLVALAFLLPPLGALALSRRLSGRFHPAQIALFALVWSTTAIAGFVNFQISLGLALLAAAFVADRLALHVLVAAALMFVHPFGVLFYAATVAALRLGPDFAGLFARSRLPRLSLSLIALAAATLAPLVAAAVWFKSGARAPLPFWGDVANIVDPVHALTIWLSPVLSYDLAVDLPAAAAVAALIAYALIAGLARPHAGLTLAAAALFLISPAAPDAIGDGSWMPQRLPIMAALLFLAGLRPGGEAKNWVPLALATPVLARTLWIGFVWMNRQGDISALTEALAAIPEGAAVITLQQEPRDWRSAPAGRFMIGSPNGVRAVGRHLGALAVFQRRAFVPTLFSVPGQHPLVVRPEWRAYAVTASSIPYPRQLGEEVVGDPYLKDWRARFAYVLLLNADIEAKSDFAPEELADLVPVTDRGFARLYRADPPVSEAPDTSEKPFN